MNMGEIHTNLDMEHKSKPTFLVVSLALYVCLFSLHSPRILIMVMDGHASCRSSTRSYSSIE